MNCYFRGFCIAHRWQRSWWNWKVYW